jgi:hypothetical protein
LQKKAPKGAFFCGWDKVIQAWWLLGLVASRLACEGPRSGPKNLRITTFSAAKTPTVTGLTISPVASWRSLRWAARRPQESSHHHIPRSRNTHGRQAPQPPNPHTIPCSELAQPAMGRKAAPTNAELTKVPHCSLQPQGLATKTSSHPEPPRDRHHQGTGMVIVMSTFGTKGSAPKSVLRKAESPITGHAGVRRRHLAIARTACAPGTEDNTTGENHRADGAQRKAAWRRSNVLASG